MSTKDSPQGLTYKQNRAILALLSEPTVKAAAAAAKIAEVTIHRWLNDPTFSAALKETRSRVFESTLTALQSASGVAVETLREVMEDKTAQPAARVSAAKTVLEISVRARDIIETEERLRLLEARLLAAEQMSR